MSLILFGGVFDPPHKGHINIACDAYNRLKPSEVIWIPSKKPPHKSGAEISFEERLNLVKLTIRDYSFFKASEIEASVRHSGYAIETIDMIRKKYPDKKLYYLLGSDEAENFSSWKSYRKILEKVTLVIGARKESGSFSEEVIANGIFLDNEIMMISSSEIRKHITKLESVDNYMNGNAIKYIAENNLYTSK